MEEFNDNYSLLGMSQFNTQPLFSKQDQIHHFEEYIPASRQIPDAKFWQLRYFQPYFDVDSEEVFNRIYKALLPFRPGKLFENGMPDLYAPFWIATTIILIFSISGSISSISSSHPWIDSSYKLVEGALLIYGFLIGVPIVLYCCLNNSGRDTSFVEIMSIFGYSLVSYIVAGLFCMVPVAWLHWLPMLLAACSGCYLVGSYLWNEMTAVEGRKEYWMMSVIVVGHLGMVYLGSVYFNSN